MSVRVTPGVLDSNACPRAGSVRAEQNMSSKGIYKSGQGYWVRLMSAIGFGVIVALGLIWLWKQIETIDFGIESTYAQVIGILVAAGIFGILGYWLIGIKTGSVDFMIATEGEMKKVNWSSKAELTRSTMAVIGLTLIVALFCWGVDVVFALIFRVAGVLQS
ncbi:MAG: preprotein translocase subunit SecE [Phycisphaerae bacterium]|nr:preprotein translocase subunit SecE [Phycisphaerae bacterium]